MNKIKAFLKGFDYAVSNYGKIEDYHFHSLPGAAWHDQSTQKIYRKSIFIGCKYMQYRYEIIASICTFLGIILLITL